MLPTVQTISDPPSRDDPVNFSARSDAFFSDIQRFRDQANAANTALTSLGQMTITEANFVLAFRNRFFGSAASDPTLRPAIPPATVGAALEIGDLYYNTASKEVRVFLGSPGWRSIGSYVTGTVDVNNYVRANTFIPFQFSFKNAPSANLIINQYSHFVIQTNTTTALNFSYSPVSAGSLDAVEFAIDLVTSNGFSVLFPSNVIWADSVGMTNTPPQFIAGRRHLLKFTTSDSGVTWLAFAEVLNASAAGAPVLI